MGNVYTIYGFLCVKPEWDRQMERQIKSKNPDASCKDRAAQQITLKYYYVLALNNGTKCLHTVR